MENADLSPADAPVEDIEDIEINPMVHLIAPQDDARLARSRKRASKPLTAVIAFCAPMPILAQKIGER